MQRLKPTRLPWNLNPIRKVRCYTGGVEEGKSAPVDGILAILGKEGEDYKALLDSETAQAPVKKGEVEETPKPDSQPAPKKAADAPKPAVKAAPAPQPVIKTAAVTSDSRIKASPLARKLSSEKGIELDRKVLADLAMNNPETFKTLVASVK